MVDFPEFMKHPANRIASSSEAPRVSRVTCSNGADGSQLAFWTCRETRVSAAHTRDYDEYMTVVQGIPRGRGSQRRSSAWD